MKTSFQSFQRAVYFSFVKLDTDATDNASALSSSVDPWDHNELVSGTSLRSDPQPCCARPLLTSSIQTRVSGGASSIERHDKGKNKPRARTRGPAPPAARGDARLRGMSLCHCACVHMVAQLFHAIPRRIDSTALRTRFSTRQVNFTARSLKPLLKQILVRFSQAVPNRRQGLRTTWPS